MSTKSSNRRLRTQGTRSNSQQNPKVYPSPSGSSQSSPDLRDHISSSRSSPSEAGSTLGRSSLANGTQAESREAGMVDPSDHAPKPRSSHSPSSSTRRLPGPQSSAHRYVTPTSPISQESTHRVPSGSFQTPQHYLPAPPPFRQHSTYVGQYAVPTQQHPLSTGHTNPSFPFHGYHHPGVQFIPPDASMMHPPMHSPFPPMMQNQAYHYQPHSPEMGSPSHAPFSSSTGSSHYAHHRANPSSPSHSPVARQPGSSDSPTNVYPGPQQFHSSGFPSTPQYSYPPHSFSASGVMYQPQYAPGSYPQPYPQSAEQEGSWWYLPPSGPVPPVQYDGNQQPYLGQFPFAFPPINPPEVEVPYGQSSPGPSPPTMPSISASHQSGSFRRFQPDPPQHSPPLAVSPPSFPRPGRERSGSTGTEAKPVGDKPLLRKNYHPNPPPHRSEWVMWAGNVPSDATHDELWQFFNEQQSTTELRGPPVNTIVGGVVSIFLISRSSCAFVNFESEAHLNSAIERFNGQTLRPNDPRCPRFVCRVRRKDDDLKAGVGAQRGMGMHTRWLKDQKGGNRATSVPDPLAMSSNSSSQAPVPQSSGDDGGSRPSSKVVQVESSSSGSASGSYASSTSSILRHHFPKRYFILKSLTQFDLDLSVRKGLWATQRHNEGILDQAYRTAKDVYLIFGVNRSGEFYGYARMAGPVIHNEEKVSWAARTTESSSSSSPLSLSPAIGRMHLLEEAIPEEVPSAGSTPNRETPPPLLSPSERKFVAKSPSPVGSLDVTSTSKRPHKAPRPEERDLVSAPAVLSPPHRDLTPGPSTIKHSLDSGKMGPAISGGAVPRRMEKAVDRAVGAWQAPAGQLRTEQGECNPQSLSVTEDQQGNAENVSTNAMIALDQRRRGKDVEGVYGVQGKELEDPREEAWGEPFKIEWLCTERLPFHRARHLRNPWNNDREVKVSRDGTELEPTVGQRLLEEWKTLAETQSVGQAPSGGRMASTSGSSRKGSGLNSWKSALAPPTGVTR